MLPDLWWQSLHALPPVPGADDQSQGTGGGAAAIGRHIGLVFVTRSCCCELAVALRGRE